MAGWYSLGVVSLKNLAWPTHTVFLKNIFRLDVNVLKSPHSTHCCQESKARQSPGSVVSYRRQPLPAPTPLHIMVRTGAGLLSITPSVGCPVLGWLWSHSLGTHRHLSL